ncbi:MAG: hypothetical protein VYD11_04295 [Actinomycetota bacterium]|jgi:hypothetical protein|nr:hypothetical protein [Actinomycetota bacterium]MEE3352678.1 hypothetical protein [Actinomycetota bacterium]
MVSIDGPGKGGCRTVQGAWHHDRPDNCAWDITVEGRLVVNRLTNPAAGRDIDSAGFDGILVQVEQAK